jgi:roadblock/LC7 domain-containing protein
MAVKIFIKAASNFKHIDYYPLNLAICASHLYLIIIISNYGANVNKKLLQKYGIIV